MAGPEDERSGDWMTSGATDRGEATTPDLEMTDPQRQATRALNDDDAESELAVPVRRVVDQLNRLPGTGRLRGDREIGRGGMAHVELAHDDVLLRRIALKVLSPSSSTKSSRIAAFLREAQITAQLDHPNIVPLHDIGISEDGRLHFSMKLMTGKTFQEWIENFPRQAYLSTDLVAVVEVVIKICDAVAFAHSRGVIHCDVTPRNVMVGEFGEVHLMDWGVARLCANTTIPPENHSRVQTSTEPEPPQRAIGTPAYMSPEHTGVGMLDARSDIFQLGGLLYFALTRSAPHVGEGRDDLFRAAMAGEIIAPMQAAPWATVPPALERIVLRAMAVSPDDRYASAGELRAALTRFMWGGEAFERISFEAGAEIIAEGAPGECAYIVASGEVEVFRTVRGERIPLRVMGKGEVFGEMSVLMRTRRSATVVALTACEVYVVDGDTLEFELEGMKPWMGAFTRALASRLKEREDDFLNSTDDG